MIKNIQNIANPLDDTILRALHKKKVLITGASGLVGINFLGSLLNAKELGCDVEVTAVLSSERPVVSDPLINSGAKLKIVDLAKSKSIDNLGRFDFIVHAAGYGQPGKFLTLKQETITLNTYVLQQLAALLEPDGRILYMSSSEVYSGLDKASYSEVDIGTTTPQHPRASYIEAKRVGETICESLRENGIVAISARLALAYGPGVWHDDKRVLNQFIQKALLLSKIEMLDAGDDFRTYGYISDIVTMLINIMIKGQQSVYNIGGNSTTTIREIAQMIGHLERVPVIKPEIETKSPGAPKSVSLNLERYIAEFGSPDLIDLKTGIQETINWYKSLYRLNQ